MSQRCGGAGADLYERESTERGEEAGEKEVRTKSLPDVFSHTGVQPEH